LITPEIVLDLRNPVAVALAVDSKSEKALGHTEATLNAILKAAEVSPDNGLMLAVVGFSYINLGRIPQAIPPLERAARLMPRNYLI
jgi:tetratricopeptide (TPR) repeat protein